MEPGSMANPNPSSAGASAVASPEPRATGSKGQTTRSTVHLHDLKYKQKRREFWGSVFIFPLSLSTALALPFAARHLRRQSPDVAQACMCSAVWSASVFFLNAAHHLCKFGCSLLPPTRPQIRAAEVPVAGHSERQKTQSTGNLDELKYRQQRRKPSLWAIYVATTVSFWTGRGLLLLAAYLLCRKNPNWEHTFMCSGGL